MAQTSQRLLLKLVPQAGLAAANVRANLRPLFDSAGAGGAPLALGSEPSWYIADLPDMEPNPWDSAHSQIGDALGIDDSAILFAEPDLPQSYPDQNEVNPGGSPLALTAQNCDPKDQYQDERPVGPGFAWHLRDEFSQLASARAAVTFSDPNRTRIAHLDTGYDASHCATPERLRLDLQRNFVSADNNPNSATDPDRGRLFDNSGHGTGTIGILAGRRLPQNNNDFLGGAPEADVVPVRIANSVVLFFTSTFAQGVNYAIQQNCDVVSISMGGLPSSAWNEAVNNAYLAGICIVAASGDCYGGLPSHYVVYPARYHRTIAACGVMANGQPYFNLPVKIIEGSWGPDSSMTTALASYTPNTSWARFGCSQTIDMDGAGTSSATPQIAAAVALWYEKYKKELPRDWRRVEAVRKALFSSAKKVDPQHFGQGILQARAALDIAPQPNLPQTPADRDSLSILRVITGLGISEPTPRERMLNLELSQRYLRNPDLQEAIPDPDVPPSPENLREFLDALIADKDASNTLRTAVAARYPLIVGAQVPGAVIAGIAPTKAVHYAPAEIPPPAFRRIRTYAVDPSFSTRLETASINEAILQVDWEEDLQPGPKGEYLEVIDQDADGSIYAPVDLNEPKLLAQDGFAPSEGNPQFHQQMVYAVSMTTIHYFEQALGRRVLWRSKNRGADGDPASNYTQRLQSKPHVLREANAYYNPDQIALMFGYFRASANDPGDHVPGSTVFSCLSHDIVAHETTHAILDGMHRYFTEPTNPDVLAFHEGFADIVALMQHFAIPEVLQLQIAKTRGDLESESLLGQMAVQFGHAIGGRGALRDAIGYIDDQGTWHRQVPDPAAYQKVMTPHERGSLLVAAVFDAFLAIYRARTADLYRIYTGGTGVLPPGSVHPDLVNRLVAEATTSAHHVLNICIRALDYVPPVDITFGEYLRGIITSDFDLVRDDPYGYRVALVEAFRRRGIYPTGLPTLSIDSLCWRGLNVSDPAKYAEIVACLKSFADECLYIEDRKELFIRTHNEGERVKATFLETMKSDRELATALGVDPALDIEVYALRRSERVGPDGQRLPQMVIIFTQQRPIAIDQSVQPVPFRGGATVLIDLKKPEIKYAIHKHIHEQDREDQTRAFLQAGLTNPLTQLMLAPGRSDRFAAVHSLAGLAG